MHEVMSLPGHIHPPLVERYKVMADMGPKQQNTPQNGRIGITHQGKDYDLAVHSEPTPDGERIRFTISTR